VLHICTKCGEQKSESEFYRRGATRKGLGSWCKSCMKVYYAALHRSPGGQERSRGRWLRSKFGISLEEYNELWARQDGRCAICRKPDPDGHWLAVDHCHNTGKVRGLLCKLHNRALGQFGDDIELLRAAIRYLETT
jgi:hypothetical protein